MGYVRHRYDAVILVTFLVIKFVGAGAYEWQCSPHSSDAEWLKVGVASRSIFSAAWGDKLLLD